jgi:DNA-directed RNA polymerase specialized sigma24 family protein
MSQYPAGAIFPPGWEDGLSERGHALTAKVAAEADDVPSQAYGAESLADYVNLLQGIGDLAQRARVIVELMESLPELRRQAVREMRETMSAVEIAQRLGISRGKVHLLLRQD